MGIFPLDADPCRDLAPKPAVPSLHTPAELFSHWDGLWGQQEPGLGNCHRAGNNCPRQQGTAHQHPQQLGRKIVVPGASLHKGTKHCELIDCPSVIRMHCCSQV